MAYEYFLWDVSIGILWLVAFVSNSQLRIKMLWSSLLALPIGITEMYFIPSYWAPQTLFDFGLKYHVAIESFAWCFFLGGLASFAYEGLFKKKMPAVTKQCHPFCRCLPLLVALFSFIFLAPLGWNTIYPLLIAMFAGGLTAFIVYPELQRHMLVGGAVFGVFYALSLALIDFLSPGWIANTWNLSALSGILIANLPLEEVVFGFFLGFLWAPLYEELCQPFKKS